MVFIVHYITVALVNTCLNSFFVFFFNIALAALSVCSMENILIKVSLLSILFTTMVTQKDATWHKNLMQRS